jgi:hypothetical protein
MVLLHDVELVTPLINPAGDVLAELKPNIENPPAVTPACSHIAVVLVVIVGLNPAPVKLAIVADGDVSLKDGTAGEPARTSN